MGIASTLEKEQARRAKISRARKFKLHPLQADVIKKDIKKARSRRRENKKYYWDCCAEASTLEAKKALEEVAKEIEIDDDFIRKSKAYLKANEATLWRFDEAKRSENIKKMREEFESQRRKNNEL